MDNRGTIYTELSLLFNMVIREQWIIERAFFSAN